MQHPPEHRTSLISRIYRFPIPSSQSCIHSDYVLNHHECSWARWGAFRLRGYFKRVFQVQGAVDGEKEHFAAEEEDEGGGGHCAETDVGLVRGGTDDEFELRRNISLKMKMLERKGRNSYQTYGITRRVANVKKVELVVRLVQHL